MAFNPGGLDSVDDNEDETVFELFACIFGGI